MDMAIEFNPGFFYCYEEVANKMVFLPLRGWRNRRVGFLITMVIFLCVRSVVAEEVTITLVGDIYLGGRVVPFIERYSPEYPFRHIKDVLKGSDVVIGNLESPLTTSEDVFMEKRFIFKAPPVVARWMKEVGFDILTLANNHIMDFGPGGLTDTLTVLKKVGILHTGAGMNIEEARRPVFVRVGGIRIGVLAYSNTLPKEFYAGRDSPGTAPGYYGYVRRDVRRLRKEADVVVVAFHWGEEGSFFPKDYQRELAHLAIESGAHLVVGHHPHVIQGIEFSGDGIVFYSLGNLVFGSYSPSAEGMIAEVTFRRDGRRCAIKSVRIIPLNVDNRTVLFSPTIPDGRWMEEFASHISTRSLSSGVGFSPDGDSIMVYRD